VDLTCYLAFPQQADEAAFDAMMRNWRACGAASIRVCCAPIRAIIRTGCGAS
jgi:hypothetical protein